MSLLEDFEDLVVVVDLDTLELLDNFELGLDGACVPVGENDAVGWVSPEDLELLLAFVDGLL